MSLAEISNSNKVRIIKDLEEAKIQVLPTEDGKVRISIDKNNFEGILLTTSEVQELQSKLCRAIDDSKTLKRHFASIKFIQSNYNGFYDH